ncbi:lipocalin family protein [Cellulophaga sp. HaHaR_3_176]|uniref:lipocalin family protein n=1 Tax=Cellulophaga sp. HaHaR_3_176 TaxID=1942464 RepID=UPI001C1FD204|nr:lipocalin family protein [Cellulophaga sp. HaHaR_3_176]QWX85234.1 lipocalin family protein [Cellulophaga sp. HaHaR_3_176]
MIKIKLAIASLTIGLLFSCEDNDDTLSSENYENLIVGEWNFVGQSVDGENEVYSDPCHQEFEVLSFGEDKSYMQTEFEDLTGAGCEQVESTTGTWDIEEQTLVLNGQSAQIIKLNEDTLIISYIDDETTVVDNLKRK